MLSYTGEKCIVCSKEFTDRDDIVSCPECGTPYHRECWKEKGECVNYALHESGRSWMAESSEKKEPAAGTIRKVCPECSFINPDDAERCRNCGADFSERECRTIDLADQKVVRIELDADADYFGMNPMEVMDESTGITIGEMADYARNNKFYYMIIFKRLKNAAVKFSVNLAAFLFPEIFFASRKMYLQAALLILAGFALRIPANIFEFANMQDAMAEAMAMYPMPAYSVAYMDKFMQFCADHCFSSRVMNFTYAFWIAIKVVSGLFANELYFRHTVEKLKKLRKTVPDYLKYRNVIKTSGGISIVGIVCVILVQFLLMMLFTMVLMIMSV